MAATIEDKVEEDTEIMEVLRAEEVDFDFELHSEVNTKRECSQKMKSISTI